MIPGMARLVAAVQGNCNIADARHAREAALCTYLLGMREFYRWEHGVPYGISPPRQDVGRWISEREALWEDVIEHDFTSLRIEHRDFDPFDAPAINEALSGSGLVYGGGIGRFGKPHFFLARLAREEARGLTRLMVCDCEYARDITAMPAALQGDTLVVRREALRQWLWEKAEGWSVKRQDGALQEALAAYDFDSNPVAAIEHMTDVETETLALHEEGEFLAGQNLPGWGSMIAGFSHKRPEILARAVRDNLADCLVTLPGLIERQAWASLALWFSNFDGMRRELFPSLVVAYSRKVGADMTVVAADNGLVLSLRGLIDAGRVHWLKVAQQLLLLDEGAIEQLSHQPAAIAL
jgi:hypothetical protein